MAYTITITAQRVADTMPLHDIEAQIAEFQILHDAEQVKLNALQASKDLPFKALISEEIAKTTEQRNYLARKLQIYINAKHMVMAEQAKAQGVGLQQTDGGPVFVLPAKATPEAEPVADTTPDSSPDSHVGPSLVDRLYKNGATAPSDMLPRVRAAFNAADGSNGATLYPRLAMLSDASDLHYELARSFYAFLELPAAHRASHLGKVIYAVRKKRDQYWAAHIASDQPLDTPEQQHKGLRHYHAWQSLTAALNSFDALEHPHLLDEKS